MSPLAKKKAHLWRYEPFVLAYGRRFSGRDIPEVIKRANRWARDRGIEPVELIVVRAHRNLKTREIVPC